MVWHFIRQFKQSKRAVRNCSHTLCESIGIHYSGTQYVITTDRLQVKSAWMEHFVHSVLDAFSPADN